MDPRRSQFVDEPDDRVVSRRTEVGGKSVPVAARRQLSEISVQRVGGHVPHTPARSGRGLLPVGLGRVAQERDQLVMQWRKERRRVDRGDGFHAVRIERLPDL